MPTAIEPGAVIDGKYRVVRRIGEGGMGTVFEGENIRIERRVAIKVLHEHVASSPEFAQRFEREARASARIGSPHVCDVLDLGDLPNGERFIVMEFLDGESLEDRLEKVTLTATELAPIAFEILEGLGTMHQAGVIHRDLKPANVFLARGRGKSEVVKILDFGVAKLLPRADEPGEMTSTGMMMGTPLYMSPEQARGARDVDGRTDLYAASVIFYRALTGAMPHTGENLHELLFRIVLEEPQAIRDLVPGVDEAFAAIVTKGLARDADQRFATAREYQEEIAAWGALQGRASLAFDVTLPSEPPPLRSVTGGYPASRIKAPITGPQPRSEAVGPPTPAVAKTQASTAAATPSAKQSGGTPIVWSEDAPEVAKRALAELEAKRAKEREARAASTGQTQLLDSKAPASTENLAASTPPSPTTPPSSQGNKSRVALAVGALVVIAAAALGLRVGKQDGGSTNASTGSASTAPVVAEPAPSEPAPAASVVVAEPAPTEPAPAASVVVAEPAPTEPAPAASAAESATPASGGAVPNARPVVAATAATPIATPKAVSAASASAAKSAAPASSAPVAAPTATASGRKFRTNID